MIAGVEAASSASAGLKFASRLALIEQLETDVLERVQYLGASLPAGVAALRVKAEAVHARLEADNARVLSRLRARIQTGRYTSRGMQRAFARYLEHAGSAPGYDALDLLVAGLFDAGEPGDERAVLEPDMVAYQPTPARAVLALLERAGINADDIVYDFGSGLGRVVLMVTLLTGARAVGLEFEPAFHEYATRCASDLRLARAQFRRCDVRDAEFGDGTVFFLYTPFRGEMLQRVLARIRDQSRGRRVRVATYGPCSGSVAQAAWLERTHGVAAAHDDLCVFESSAT